MYFPPVNTQGDVGSVKMKLDIDWPALTGDADVALALNDVVQCFKLPGWVKLLSAYLDNSVDLDDHATPTLDLDILVTDGTTTKQLLNGGTTAGQVGRTTAASDFDADGIDFVTDNGDYIVILKAIAAAAGDAAASAKTKLMVEYTRVMQGSEGIKDLPSPNP